MMCGGEIERNQAAERNATDHAAVIGQFEVAADQFRMPRQCGLRDRAEAERLGCQHEIADIGAAVDRAVGPQRLGGVDDGDMRCAEEVVVLQRLLRIAGLVAARNAERVVELEAAFAAAIEIDTKIFARRREVVSVLSP